MENLQRGQRGAIKSTQCLENTICEERVTDVELFSKHKGRLGNNVIMTFRVMPGSHPERGGPRVSLATQEAGPMLDRSMGTPKQKSQLVTEHHLLAIILDEEKM